MAKLILRRLHRWPDIRQSYEIHLDGTPVASIGSGKTVEIEVAPGLVEITATMGPFLSSQPVRLDIAPEGDHRVEVGTFLRNPPLLAIGLTSMAWLFLATIVVLGAPFASVAARFFWPGGLFLGTLLLGLSPLVARVACATRWRDRYLYIRPIAPAASTLDLSHTRVGDAGLACLGDLSKLEHLDLSGTRVTDTGLASLAGLSNCWFLSVQGTGVTDRGVAQLSARFPAIRVFYRRTAVKPGPRTSVAPAFLRNWIPQSKSAAVE